MIKSNQEIKSVLEEFSRAGIKYAIIRNYGFLLENRIYEGKDIDLVVLSKDMNKIRKIMNNFSFGRVPMNPFSMHEGYAKYVPEDKKLVQFHFHINGVIGRHIRYLDAEGLLKRRVKREFFYAASSEDEFLAILLHTLLDLEEFKEKYIKDLEKLEKNDLNYFYIKSKLRKVISNTQTEDVLRLISGKKYRSTEKIMPSLKRTFENRNFFKIPFVFIGGAVWKLFSFRLAPLISLIGMDGAGKTTATNALKEIFEKNKVKYEIIYTGRGRNNILPIQFFGKAYKKAESKVESSKESGKTKSAPIWKKIIYTLAAPVFAFDLFLRYWLVIFPKRFTKQAVITDRYATDMLLMANVPGFVRKALCLLFPKPTLTIYLWNTAEVLHKRKPDHPFDDLKRQEKIFYEINRKIKLVAIKSEGVEQTVKKVSEMVFSRIFY